MSGGGRSIRALSVGVASSAAPLRFRSALSTEPATAAAVAECIGKLLAEPPHAGSASTDASPALPSLLLVWLAGHAPGTVLEQLATHDPELARRALGCTSYSAVHAPAAADRPPVADGAGVSPEGAVGALLGGEVETLGGESALSMVAAWMPGVRVDHWTVDTPRLPDLADLDLGSLVLGSSDARARAATADPATFLLFATPQFRAPALLRLLDAAFPAAPKLGALADLADPSEDAAVFAGGKISTDGAAGVVLRGDVEVDVVLSPGLRPITDGMVAGFAAAPDGAGLVLATLGGQPARNVLSACERALGTAELRLAVQPRALAAGEGAAAREASEALRAHDALLPLAVGRAAPDGGGVPVAAASEGAVLADALAAVCARDGLAAALDLSVGLGKAVGALQAASCALLLSTGARGASRTRPGLFGAPGHDVITVTSALRNAGGGARDAPVGGAHAGAPIAALVAGGRTHVLPEAAIVALFRRRAAAPPAVFAMDTLDRAALGTGGALPAALGAAIDAAAAALPAAIAAPGPARESDVPWVDDSADDDDDDADADAGGASRGGGGGAASPPLRTLVATGAVRTLPLFHLPSETLFPAAERAYVIFEPRYRAMVRYCLAAGAPVGVLGGGGVGSVARVREVHELPDGRYGLALVGGERFVLERSWLAPFSFGLRLGAVRTFGDAPPADADGGRAARLAIDGALRELAGAGAELTAALPFVRDWPTSRLDALDDEALSFALAEELPVHVSAKRLWLRTQDTAGRLRALAKVLESVVAEVAASQKAALAGEADAAAGAADAAAEQRKPSGGV